MRSLVVVGTDGRARRTQNAATVTKARLEAKSAVEYTHCPVGAEVRGMQGSVLDNLN